MELLRLVRKITKTDKLGPNLFWIENFRKLDLSIDDLVKSSNAIYVASTKKFKIQKKSREEKQG